MNTSTFAAFVDELTKIANDGGKPARRFRDGVNGAVLGGILGKSKRTAALTAGGAALLGEVAERAEARRLKTKTASNYMNVRRKQLADQLLSLKSYLGNQP